MAEKVVYYRALADFAAVRREAAKTAAANKAMEEQNKKTAASNDRLSASETSLGRETAKAQSSTKDALTRTAEARRKLSDEINKNNAASIQEINSMSRIESALNRVEAARLRNASATQSVTSASAKLSQAQDLVARRTENVAKAEQEHERILASEKSTITSVTNAENKLQTARDRLTRSITQEQNANLSLERAQQRVLRTENDLAIAKSNVAQQTAKAAQEAKNAADKAQSAAEREARTTANRLASLDREQQKVLSLRATLKAATDARNAAETATRKETDAESTYSAALSRAANQIRKTAEAKADYKKLTDSETDAVNKVNAAEKGLIRARQNEATQTGVINNRLKQVASARAIEQAALERVGQTTARYNELVEQHGASSIIAVNAEKEMVKAELDHDNAATRVKNSVDNLEQSERRLATTHQAVAAAEDKLETKIRNADKEMRTAGGSGNAFTKILDGLASGFDRGGAGAGILSAALTGVKFGAIGVAVVALVQSISALVSGLFILSSAVAPALGALAALAPIAFTAAAALGTIKLAFSGVGNVLKAYTAQQKAQATQSGKTANTEISNAESIKNAQLALRDAREQVGITAQNVSDSIAKAYKTEQDAQDSLTDSQKSLSQARIDAKKNIDDLRQAVIDAALAEKGAALDLEDSKAALTRTLNDPTATRLQREQAQLAVEQAQNQADAAVKGSKDSQKAYDDAATKGVEGSDDVIKAKKAEADAVYNLQQAQKDYNKTVVDGARQNRDAQEAVAKAIQSLADAQRSATESTGSAATAANTYQYALDKLTPAGKAFVLTLISMKKYADQLKATAQNSLLPGLTADLQRLPVLFPVVNSAIATTGKALSDFSKKATDEFTSPAWIRSLQQLGDNSPKIIGPLGSALLKLLDVFRLVAVAAIPLADKVSSSIDKMATHLDEITKKDVGNGKLVAFLDKSWRTAQQLGRIIKNLAIGIFNLGKIANPVGQGMLDSIEKLTLRFDAFTKKNAPQIRQFFEDVNVNVRKVLALLGDLTKGFFKAGASKGLAPIIDAIRNQLEPALKKLFQNFNEGDFGTKLVALLTTIVGIFTTLTKNGSPLSIFVATLTDLLKVIGAIISIPGVAPALGAIASALAVMAAVKFVGAISGIGKLTSALSSFIKLRKEATLAAAAGDDLTLKQRLATSPISTARSLPAERRASKAARAAARNAPSVDDILNGGTTGGRHAAGEGEDYVGRRRASSDDYVGTRRAPEPRTPGAHRDPTGARARRGIGRLEEDISPVGGGAHRDPENQRARRTSRLSSLRRGRGTVTNLDDVTDDLMAGTNRRLAGGAGGAVREGEGALGSVGRASRGIRGAENGIREAGKLEKAAKGVGKAGKGLLGALGGLVGLGPAGVLVVGAIAGLVLLYMKVKWFRDFVNAAWKDIQKWSIWLYQNGIKPAFEWIKSAIADVVAWFKKHQETFQQIFDAMGKAAQIFYKYYVKPYFALAKVELNLLVGAVVLTFNLIKNAFLIAEGEVKILAAVIKAAFLIIKDIIVGVTNLIVISLTTSWNILKTTAQTIFTVIKDILTGNFSGAWDAIKNGWMKIWGYLTGAWTSAKDTVGKLFSGIAKAITDAFGTVRSGLSNIWDGISGDIQSAFNFITQKVMNPFINAINSVLSHLPGGFKIPDIPPVGGSAPKGGSATAGGSNSSGTEKHSFAKGGVLPGYTPGLDVHKFYSPTGGELHLSGGEGILVPEAVRALGGAAGIQNINSTASNGRVRPSGNGHFAGGGVLGKIKSVAGDVVGGVRSVAAWGSKEALDAATAPLRALINKIPSDLIRQLANGAFSEIGTAAYNFIKGKQAQGNTTKTSSTQNSVGLSGSQMSNAEVIKAIGLAMGGSPRDVEIAYMTAMVESSMRNLANPNVPESMSLPHDGTGSDHDSVGMFQQRNSWGTAAQRLNPAETSRLFFERLLGLGSSRLNMSMGQAAQTVQVSAFPDRYAEWQDFAVNLYSQLSGPASLTTTSRNKAAFANGGVIQKFNAGGIVKGIGPGGNSASIAALRMQSLVDAPNGNGLWTSALTNQARKRLTGVSPSQDVTSITQPPHALGPLSKNNSAIPMLLNWMNNAAPNSYDALWKNNPIARNPMFPIQAYMARPDLFSRYKWRKNYNPVGMVAKEQYSYFNRVNKYRSDMGLSKQSGAWTSDMDAPSDHILAHALGMPHPADWPHPWSGPVTAVEEELAQQERSNALNTEWFKDLGVIANWGYTALVDELLDKGITDGLEIARSAVKDQSTAKKLNDAIVAGDNGYGGLAAADQATILKAIAIIASGTPTKNKGLRDVSGTLQVPDYSIVNLYNSMSSQLAALPANLTTKFNSDVDLFRKGLFYANTGAIVPGQGNTDTVPAMLTPGEGVLNNMAMRLLGHDNFNKMNNGVLPQFFNTGGIVLSPNIQSAPVVGITSQSMPNVKTSNSKITNGETYITNIDTTIQNATTNSAYEMNKMLQRKAATGEFNRAAKVNGVN